MTSMIFLCFAAGLLAVVFSWVIAYVLITKAPGETTLEVAPVADRPLVGAGTTA